MQSTPTLIDDPAERRARQLAYAQELQTLAMGLARTAAARAADALEPEPVFEQPPNLAALAFARFARIARDMIHLENRIADGALERAARRAYRTRRDPAAAEHDDRRPLLREVLRAALRGEPDQAARRQELEERLDAELGGDPEGRIPVSVILIAIAEQCGIGLDLARLPDDALSLHATTPTPLRRQNL